MQIRTLGRHEIEQVWTIDRAELIEHIYTLQDGALVLQPHYFDARGWPPGEAEHTTPRLYDCFDRGGQFFGCFDGQQLIGMAALDTRWLGAKRDLLQLAMLHVSHAYRKHGVGTTLFERVRSAARDLGARGLYISATPSQNTIHFYRRFGAVVIAEPDPELFVLEPEDIHLECPV
jgi:predicted N-acetyltransferase YhbS